MTNNLMVQSAPVFQVTGFDTNYWVNNTVVNTKVSKVCAPDTTAALTGTTYAVLSSGPSPGPAPGPSPAPVPPGWTATYCQSCEHNTALKDMGKNYGSVVDCISACGYEAGCKFANYAETSDNHCVLYAECSPPYTHTPCDAAKHEWWTTWEHTGEDLHDVVVSEVAGDCWTHGHCICDDGTQTKINEDDLKQLIRDTVFMPHAIAAVQPTALVV